MASEGWGGVLGGQPSNEGVLILNRRSERNKNKNNSLVFTGIKSLVSSNGSCKIKA